MVVGVQERKKEKEQPERNQEDPRKSSLVTRIESPAEFGTSRTGNRHQL